MNGLEVYAGKIVDKATQGTTLRWVYAIFCSFWAFCAVGSLLHLGTGDRGEADARIANLGEAPLRVAHTLFTEFSAPAEWIFSLDMYLTKTTPHATFTVSAWVVAILATLLLGANMDIGTVQGSSLWLALAILIQLGSGGVLFLTIVVSFVVRGAYLARVGDLTALGVAFLDLVWSALSVVLVPLILLLGGRTNNT